MDKELLHAPRQYKQLSFEDKDELRTKVFAALEDKRARRVSVSKLLSRRGIYTVACLASCIASVAAVATISIGMLSSSAKDYVKPDFQQKVSMIILPASSSSEPEGAAASAFFGTNSVAKILDNYAEAKEFVGEDFPTLENQPVGQYSAYKRPDNGQFQIGAGVYGNNITTFTIAHGAKGLPDFQVYQVMGHKQPYYSEDALQLGSVEANVWHLTCDD